MLVLWVQNNQGIDQEFPVSEEMRIGRQAGNTLQLADSLVSGEHALIQVRPDGVWLIDLGSTNGTWMNGACLLAHTPYQLALGQQIVIGSATLQLVETAQPQPPVSYAAYPTPGMQPGQAPAGYAPTYAPAQKKRFPLLPVLFGVGVLVVFLGVIGLLVIIGGRSGTPSVASNTSTIVPTDLLPEQLPPSTPSQNEAPLPPNELETVTISGKVVLPSGASLAASSLKIITNLSTTVPSQDGSFSLQAMRGTQNTTLTAAANSQGNAVLLRASRGDDTARPADLSADSSARALVLFDLNFLSMPLAVQQKAAALVERHPDLPRLTEAVKNAILQDAVDPLNYNTHTDLLTLSAKITGDVIADMQKAAFVPASGLHLVSYVQVPLPSALNQEDDLRKYARVEDDADHNLPSVNLVTSAYSYYRVTVYKDGAAWSNTKNVPYLIERLHPYSFSWEWHPRQFQSLTLDSPTLGDGKLRFEFNKEKSFTVIDAILSTGGAILGLPITIYSGPTTLALKGGLEGSQIAEDLMTIVESAKGESLSDVGKDVSTFFASHTSEIAMITAEFIKLQAQNAGIKEAAALGAKAVALNVLKGAMIAYSTSDAVFMLYSLANAPDQVVEEGIQYQGKYPSLLINLDAVLEDPNANCSLGTKVTVRASADGIKGNSVLVFLKTDEGTNQALQNQWDPPQVKQGKWEGPNMDKYLKAGRHTFHIIFADAITTGLLDEKTIALKVPECQPSGAAPLSNTGWINVTLSSTSNELIGQNSQGVVIPITWSDDTTFTNNGSIASTSSVKGSYGPAGLFMTINYPDLVGEKATCPHSITLSNIPRVSELYREFSTRSLANISDIGPYLPKIETLKQATDQCYSGGVGTAASSDSFFRVIFCITREDCR